MDRRVEKERKEGGKEGVNEKENKGKTNVRMKRNEINRQISKHIVTETNRYKHSVTTGISRPF